MKNKPDPKMKHDDRHLRDKKAKKDSSREHHRGSHDDKHSEFKQNDQKMTKEMPSRSQRELDESGNC